MPNHNKENTNKFRRTSDQIKLEEFLIGHINENVERMKEDLESTEYAGIPHEDRLTVWLQREITKTATKKRAAMFLGAVNHIVTPDGASRGRIVNEEFRVHLELK
jgi:hypothetical protein